MVKKEYWAKQKRDNKGKWEKVGLKRKKEYKKKYLQQKVQFNYKQA